MLQLDLNTITNLIALAATVRGSDFNLNVSLIGNEQVFSVDISINAGNPMKESKFYYEEVNLNCENFSVALQNVSNKTISMYNGHLVEEKRIEQANREVA